MMKRKVTMIGLAMMTFSSHGVFANGVSKDDYKPSYSSGVFSYVPHYGAEGWLYPLMGHLSAPVALPQRNKSDTWRLELAPPATVSESSDNPLFSKDKRVGVSFKLDF